MQQKPLVLIIDDDPTLRDIMRLSLEDSGFQVEDRGDGVTGLKAFETLGPDLVLLDVMMPEMNGYQVCQEIRRRPNGTHFPIIMVTGLDDTASIDMAYEVGATDFITKPINCDVLGHRVRYILRASMAEQEVSTSHARLHDAIESIPAELSIYDADDRLIMVNSRATERNPGLKQVLQPGSSYAALVQAIVDGELVKDAVNHKEAWLRQRSAMHAGTECTFIEERKDGRWVQSYERRMTDGGTVHVGVDITELKLREYALEEARLVAESADRAKSEFLAMATHELRTPLNAVLGFANLIDMESSGPLENTTYKEYIQLIIQSGSHLLDVVNDILDMSKIEAGKYKLSEEVVDVEKLVETWVQVFKTQATEAGITLTYSHPDKSPQLYADAPVTKKMLINLVSNAIKFTEPGNSVHIEIAQADDNRVSLCVCDTGIGISEEDLSRVISPFAQVDGTLSRKYEGTGLGLPLTKSFIEMHGGELRIESKLHEGTTVRLIFPAERTVLPGADDATSAVIRA